MEIWNIIVQSNTFNFLIVALLIAFLFKKFAVVSKLHDATEKVKEEINISDKAKTQSFEELKNADELLKNVNQEIEKIETSTNNSINFLEQSSLKEQEKEIKIIEENANKSLSFIEQKAVQNLSKKTILASFELAKKHIIKLLEDNPEYHQKFIKESIKELDGLKK